jgi:transposase-like protein
MPARGKWGRFRKDPLARERALEALQLMRSEGLSLTAAARKAGTTPATVRKHVRNALRRTQGGRYLATPSDRLVRHLWLLTPKGVVEVAVRGSRQAELVASYMAAVDWYLRRGDASRLAAFRGKGIRSGDRFFPFLTDTAALDKLARAGEVSFERLYTRRA